MKRKVNHKEHQEHKGKKRKGIVENEELFGERINLINHEWTRILLFHSREFASIRGSSALKTEVVVQAERFFQLAVQGISNQSQSAECTRSLPESDIVTCAHGARMF